MRTKIDYMSVAPEVVGPFLELGKLLAKSGIEASVLTLSQIRASQINGCAFCLALHWREGQAQGESNDRLACLSAWRESPWYSARECAALEYTEALTQLANTHLPSDLIDRMKEQFTEREIVYLTLATSIINTYNRFNVAFGTSPEHAESVFKMLHPETAAAHA